MQDLGIPLLTGAYHVDRSKSGPNYTVNGTANDRHDLRS